MHIRNYVHHDKNLDYQNIWLKIEWYCFGDRRLNFISIATCSVQDNTASDRLAFPKLPDKHCDSAIHKKLKLHIEGLLKHILNRRLGNSGFRWPSSDFSLLLSVAWNLNCSLRDCKPQFGLF
jgi:hypothetical protein